MKILIIEDNQKLAENIKRVLQSLQYDCLISSSLTDGIKSLRINTYDLVILDLNLPDGDGLEICKSIRAEKSNIPILILSARIGVNSIINGLNTGADDYLTKPFDMDELLARVRALLRRPEFIVDRIYKLGEIEINLSEYRVYKNKQDVALSHTEMKIIEYLLKEPGHPQNATAIYDYVWNGDSEIIWSDTLKVHISRIRKKLGKDFIITTSGYGYSIRPN